MGVDHTSDSEDLVERFILDLIEFISDDPRIVWASTWDFEQAYAVPDVRIHLSCAGKEAMYELTNDVNEWLAPIRRVAHSLVFYWETIAVFEDGLRVNFRFNDAEHAHRRPRGRLLKETPGHFTEEPEPLSERNEPVFLRRIGEFWCHVLNVPRELRRHGVLNGYLTVANSLHYAYLATKSAREELGEEMEGTIVTSLTLPELSERIVIEQTLRLATTFDRIASAICRRHDLDYPEALADAALARIRRESEPFLR